MRSSNFIKKGELFSKVIVLVSTPTNRVWELPLVHIPANASYFQIFTFTTLVCIVGSQYDFSVYFQVINELE